MKLSPTEVRAAIYALRVYRDSGQPMWPSVTALTTRLENALRCGEVSPRRQSQRTENAESVDVEFIGTRLAARLLGWPMRRVQRRAADLEGRRVGDRLVFPRQVVEEYRDYLPKERST